MVNWPDEGRCMAQIFDRITMNPRQCGGRPCVRGMRIRVSDVLELLAEGMTTQQILDEHPDFLCDLAHSECRVSMFEFSGHSCASIAGLLPRDLAEEQRSAEV